MKIEIVCPRCGNVLTDKFFAASCKLSFGRSKLQMECCRCDQYVTVEIEIASQPAVEADADTQCTCTMVECNPLIHPTNAGDTDVIF